MSGYFSPRRSLRCPGMQWAAVSGVVVVLSSCQRDQRPVAPATTHGEAPPPVTAASSEGASEDHQTVEVALFFPSSTYVQTGDESLPRVIAERRQLKVKSGTSPAAAAVAALQAGPTSDETVPLFRAGWHVNSVSVSGKTATVDFRQQGLSGGSLEERLLIEALVRTLTALPEVDQVQFTVDGHSVESLMGHLSAEKPLSVDDVKN